MDNNHTLLATGGYAKVYYNEELQIVKKIQPKYNEERTLHYSTIIDLAAHESLSYIPGLPMISHIESDRDDVELHMPYYGRPLHEYISMIPVERREEFCVHALIQIVDTCIQLYENGLQHTDIKPSNILVDDDENITIIDFNILSSRIMSNYDGLKWSEAIGTWNYAAPEIICSSKPCSSSVVWTLGLLIAVIVEKFPVEKSRFLSKDEVHDREHWVRTYQALKEAHPKHLPLRTCTPRRMSQSLEYIYSKCVQWAPDKRLELYELRSMLYVYWTGNVSPPLHIHIVSWLCDPTTMDTDCRTKAIWKLYDACILCRKHCLFVRCVSWMDRLGLIEAPKLTLCAIFILAWMLHGEYLFDNNKLCQRIFDIFDVCFSKQDVMNEVWHVGEQLSWQLFEKTIDVYWCEFGKRDVLVEVCQVLLLRKTPYTMEELATRT